MQKMVLLTSTLAVVAALGLSGIVAADHGTTKTGVAPGSVEVTDVVTAGLAICQNIDSSLPVSSRPSASQGSRSAIDLFASPSSSHWRMTALFSASPISAFLC